ncbi:hypothetical protein HDV06_003887 [Boothiomyces sp. JEL0866]|nr:hypothetical protein HDV06_003887 [Boothiomyces sp. JEL0866]
MKELGFDDYPADYVLNSELISMIALEYNFNPIIVKQEVITAEPRPEPEDWSVHPPRPPVITIMGHVDHGKTTLLDSLRKTSVAAGEAGGITQHIGAFSVLLPSQKRITFLDTPGHAAFSQMRARGAQVTDIVVLIVAADDGVMPQTIEAIDHAQKANVPIIVAINKCDKPGVNPKKIKEDLLRYNITVEEYGGDIPAVEISGKTGKGLAELEETILAIAEVNDYRGDPTGPVEATVVESKMTKGFGNVATVIVKRGTLVPGAVIVAGESLCKVRKMIDEHGKSIKSIGPSGPIEVLGWKDLPSAGELVLQVESEFIGKKVIESRKRLAEFHSSVESVDAMNEKAINKSEDSQVTEEAPKKNEYRVIIKADVDGSTEAIANVLSGIPSHEVSCNIINSSVGALSEADVNYAIASKADIITFNIPVQKSMITLANQNKINIHSHNVIYTLIDQVKASMSELLPPEIVTNVTGEASIAQIFNITVKGKQEPIAGCKVFNGKITKNSILRVVRDGTVLHEGKVKTFKHHKKDILEAAKGLECGIAVEGFSEIQEGDVLQSISIIHKKRTIE